MMCRRIDNWDDIVCQFVDMNSDSFFAADETIEQFKS